MGATAGVRLPERVRSAVTDALGLMLLVLGVIDVVVVRDLGTPAVLVLLGALVLGAISGGIAGLEERFEAAGEWLRRRLGRDAGFAEGFVSASLIVAVGPLAVLGPIADGLGQGIGQLVVKSVVDGVICLAYAAALGWGVAASAVTIVAVQGPMTVLGATVGAVLPGAEISALSAAGGVLLLGLGLRLLAIKRVPVVNMLPALVFAPLLTWAVAAF
ncbi:DUF554 family protein [Actinoplanes sp. CA-054009]